MAVSPCLCAFLFCPMPLLPCLRVPDVKGRECIKAILVLLSVYGQLIPPQNSYYLRLALFTLVLMQAWMRINFILKNTLRKLFVFLLGWFLGHQQGWCKWSSNGLSGHQNQGDLIKRWWLGSIYKVSDALDLGWGSSTYIKFLWDVGVWGLRPCEWLPQSKPLV